MTLTPAYDDPRDPRIATHAAGLLQAANLAGVLEAADVHVAQRLGSLARETDEDVLLAIALTVRAVRSGSVCLDLATAQAVTPDLALPDPDAWKAVVTASTLTQQGILRLVGDLLYLDRYWAEEQQVVADLGTRAAPPELDQGVLAEALRAYFPDDKYADQRAAAATAVRHRTSVITGGPGTGKTSTVARLLGVLLRVHAASEEGDRPLRIAMAAPTGKAAARMVQAVQASIGQRGLERDGEHADAVTTIDSLKASTLHRLLGWTPNSTRFRHHRGNRLPYDVVVVDETSMLSLTMTARLLEAVRPSARLVLVGDADQLASVDAGAVLKDLVDAPATVQPPGGGRRPSGQPLLGVAHLSESRRFGARIGALATAVRDGEVDAAFDALRAGSDDIVWADPDDLPPLLAERAVALRTAAESGDPSRALAALDGHRLLCAHRDGPSGVSHWNRLVERLLMEATDRDVLRDWYAGRPFVVNSNDYGLDLWNGDTGVACRVDGGLVAVVGDTGRRIPTSRLADVTTAHAMTVHRSQGSQFDEVTVLLPEADSRILTRELFYTALTRAKERVRVVGSEDAVRAAVTRRAQRATGLARRLGGSAPATR